MRSYPDPVEEVKKLGYKIRYVDHEIIKDYNACYNVVYSGKVVKPRAADVLGIPLNEIWISRKWQKYEKFILFHELAEIKLRAADYEQNEAHILAELVCIAIWRDDPNWQRFIVEKFISDIENEASYIVQKKIDEVMKILDEKLGYRCPCAVTFNDLYTYMLSETPTSDTVDIVEVLSNKYYLLHEVVEICELKKKGIPINRRTIVDWYPDVYRAHIRALELELEFACREGDRVWIENRISMVLNQLDFDCELLRRYLNEKEVEKIKNEVLAIVNRHRSIAST